LAALPGLTACDLFGDDDDVAIDDDDAVDDDDAADDDDSGATDDDDVTPGGNCSDLGEPGVFGEVPCDFEAGGDVWQFIVQGGQEVAVVVDTVSPDTTFDPRFRLVDALSTFLTSGDDECDCAWPPPLGPDDWQYGCPQGVYVAEGTEQLRVHISGFLEEICVAGDFGGYVLQVAIDGEPVVPTQTVDDGPTVFGG